MKKFSYHFTHKTGNIVAYKTHGPIKEEKNGRNENRKQYSNVACLCTMEDIGFENFIHLALDYTEKDAKKLFYQANIQGISVNTAY